MVKGKERERKPGDLPPNDQALGDFVRRRRKALGLKVKDLAHEIGVSTSYISQVELGRQVDPSLKVLRRFATVLEVDMQTLLGVVAPDATQPGKPAVDVPPPLATLAHDLSLDSKIVEMLAGINIDAQQPTTATDWLMVLLVIRRACGMVEELDLARYNRSTRHHGAQRGRATAPTVAHEPHVVPSAIGGKDQPGGGKPGGKVDGQLEMQVITATSSGTETANRSSQASGRTRQQPLTHEYTGNEYSNTLTGTLNEHVSTP